MAGSLVADYNNSSDSDSFEGEESDSVAVITDNALSSVHKEDHETPANYFTADGYEDTDVNEQPVERQSTVRCDTATKRLPNPLSGSTEDDDDESHSSVFVNYYHRAERAKLAVLEQHVKLTNAKDSKAGAANGDKHKKGDKKRQVCLNFQRGRCRYGQKCRFAHTIESEIDHAVDGVAAIAKDLNNPRANQFGSPPPFFYDQHAIGDANGYVNDDDDDEGNKKRKKRSGITDTLVPPKRALHSLEKQRQAERPWTVKPK